MLDKKIYQLPTFLHKENNAMSGQKKSYLGYLLVFEALVTFRKMSEMLYFEQTSKIEAFCQE